MFKRRAKTPSDNNSDMINGVVIATTTTSGSGPTASDGTRVTVATAYYTSRPEMTSSSSAISTVDYDDDYPTAAIIEQRITQRNLTVSRSGRYKSKSRPRPALNHPTTTSQRQDDTSRPTVNSSAAQQQVYTGGLGVVCYGPVAVSSPAAAGPSQFRGLTTAL